MKRKPEPSFCNYPDWKRRHLRECPHLFRDAQRGSLSRVYLCSWSLVCFRCMYSKCPLVRGLP